MATYQLGINIAQHAETGEYAVVINAVSDGESIVQTYLDAETARAMARGLDDYADDIDRRNAAATREASAALANMMRS